MSGFGIILLLSFILIVVIIWELLKEIKARRE